MKNKYKLNGEGKESKITDEEAVITEDLEQFLPFLYASTLYDWPL